MIGSMTLSQLAKELDAELQGEDAMFSTVSTDTRSLEKGDLYVALVGENFDGNNFLEQAKEKGACAALVTMKAETELTALRVADTRAALGRLAAINRQRSTARLVAVTGSQGKTTVKEMIGAIFTRRADSLITEANLNNTIGVPLTLLKINESHQFVVVEMGANAAGEIAFSANSAQPDVALITNACPTHIEGFGSLQAVVAAKGEIIDGLKADGTLILNGDDANIDSWVLRAGNKKTVRFSGDSKQQSEYYCTDIDMSEVGSSRFKLHTSIGEQAIHINFLGRHNIDNAVAAAATAIEAGASLQNVVEGLRGLNPVTGRLSSFPGRAGCTVIDDSYNASPDSFVAAIDVLSATAGRKILVAGDMTELGKETDSAHAAVGDYASRAGIDELWASGEKSRLIVDSFQGCGKYFLKKDELVQALLATASSELTILVKGSRLARMEQVVAALKLDGES